MERKKISKLAFAAMAGVEAYTRKAVSRDLSHLVRLRASALNGCRYCIAMHRRDAFKAGWSEDRVAATEDWTNHLAEFSEDELTVLRLTDAVTHIDGDESVPDELWSAVVLGHGDSGAGHILMEIVTINAWNRIAVATRLDPATLR